MARNTIIINSLIHLSEKSGFSSENAMQCKAPYITHAIFLRIFFCLMILCRIYCAQNLSSCSLPWISSSLAHPDSVFNFWFGSFDLNWIWNKGLKTKIISFNSNSTAHTGQGKRKTEQNNHKINTNEIWVKQWNSMCFTMQKNVLLCCKNIRYFCRMTQIVGWSDRKEEEKVREVQ